MTNHHLKTLFKTTPHFVTPLAILPDPWGYKLPFLKIQLQKFLNCINISNLWLLLCVFIDKSSGIWLLLHQNWSGKRKKEYCFRGGNQACGIPGR